MKRTTASMSGIIPLLIATFATPALIGAQQFTKAGKITHLSAPVRMDTTGTFEDAIARVGSDIFVAGQPTERGLRELRAAGVTTVVNLRTPPEMARVPFDERALATSLGMEYIALPVRGSGDYPYAPATVDRFAEAVRTAKGKVLLHCTVGWRASHLWAAYLIARRGVPVEDALANARAINLMDEHHMTGSNRQPVEEFLGRDLPTLGKAHQ